MKERSLQTSSKELYEGFASFGIDCFVVFAPRNDKVPALEIKAMTYHYKCFSLRDINLF